MFVKLFCNAKILFEVDCSYSLLQDHWPEMLLHITNISYVTRIATSKYITTCMV
jgi:hypothetical protein